MKTISLQAWAHKTAVIESLAQARIIELAEKVYRIEVLESDIEGELLRLSRCHGQYLCKDLGGDWAEVGEQVYAMWRGWV